MKAILGITILTADGAQIGLHLVRVLRDAVSLTIYPSPRLLPVRDYEIHSKLF